MTQIAAVLLSGGADLDFAVAHQTIGLLIDPVGDDSPAFDKFVDIMMTLGLLLVNLLEDVLALSDAAIGLRVRGSTAHLSSLGLLLFISFDFVELHLPRVEELVVLIFVELGQLVFEVLVHHVVRPALLGRPASLRLVHRVPPALSHEGVVSLGRIVGDSEALGLLARAGLFHEFVVSDDPGGHVATDAVVSNHAFRRLLLVQIRQLQILNLHRLLEFELIFLFLIELF